MLVVAAFHPCSVRRDRALQVIQLAVSRAKRNTAPVGTPVLRLAAHGFDQSRCPQAGKGSTRRPYPTGDLGAAQLRSACLNYAPTA